MFHTRKLLFYHTGKVVAFALVQPSGWRRELEVGLRHTGSSKKLDGI